MAGQVAVGGGLSAALGKPVSLHCRQQPAAWFMTIYGHTGRAGLSLADEGDPWAVIGRLGETGSMR